MVEVEQTQPTKNDDFLKGEIKKQPKAVFETAFGKNECERLVED